MRISDWSSDVCSSDLGGDQIHLDDLVEIQARVIELDLERQLVAAPQCLLGLVLDLLILIVVEVGQHLRQLRLRAYERLVRKRFRPFDRKTTRLNSSHYCATRLPSSA